MVGFRTQWILTTTPNVMVLRDGTEMNLIGHASGRTGRHFPVRVSDRENGYRVAVPAAPRAFPSPAPIGVLANVFPESGHNADLLKCKQPATSVIALTTAELIAVVLFAIRSCSKDRAAVFAGLSQLACLVHSLVLFEMAVRAEQKKAFGMCSQFSQRNRSAFRPLAFLAVVYVVELQSTNAFAVAASFAGTAPRSDDGRLALSVASHSRVVGSQWRTVRLTKFNTMGD